MLTPDRRGAPRGPSAPPRCPSNAVGRRSDRAALRREPAHVAQCAEAMSHAMTELSHEAGRPSPVPSLSVKHRLGVRDAANYGANADTGDDDATFQECLAFVRAATLGSHVSKVQVHARIGLLGILMPQTS